MRDGEDVPIDGEGPMEKHEAAMPCKLLRSDIMKFLEMPQTNVFSWKHMCTERTTQPEVKRAHKSG